MLLSPKFTGAFTGFIPRLSHIPQFITRRQQFFDPGCGARLIKVTVVVVVVVDFSSIRGGFPSFTRMAGSEFREFYLGFGIEKKMLLVLPPTREDLLAPQPNRGGINFYIRTKGVVFIASFALTGVRWFMGGQNRGLMRINTI